MQEIELRCDRNPSRLFARVLKSGDVVVSSNRFEFKCRDCAKILKASEVFHYFDISGVLVETTITR